MKRIDLDYLVIVGMILSGVYVSLTGVITDLLGLHQFAFHRYAGYGVTGFAILHLILNWRRATAYLRWRFRPLMIGLSRAPQGNPTPLDRRGFLVAIGAALGGFVLGRLGGEEPTAGIDIVSGDLGTRYHQWSTPGNTLALARPLDWGGRPAPYKSYAQAQQITLPDPGRFRGLRLEETIERRRSKRDFSDQPLSPEALSELLYAAQGITERRGALRAAPSAGALFPIEVYPVVHNVQDLEAGIYHYSVPGHTLEMLRPGDFRLAIMQAGIWQDFLGQANVCFVLSAIFQRTRWKYQERTYRYILMEAGHIGQNLYLAATSMGLGCCAVGAFLDRELNDLLGLDGESEASLYILAVGRL